MKQDSETPVATEQLASSPGTELKPEFVDLHVRIAPEMREKLETASQLAFKLGDIPKGNLVNLMDLFINWGMEILKKKWLDRVGYK